MSSCEVGPISHEKVVGHLLPITFTPLLYPWAHLAWLLVLEHAGSSPG